MSSPTLSRVVELQGPFVPAQSYFEMMLEGARERPMDPRFIKWLESMWRAVK